MLPLLKRYKIWILTHAFAVFLAAKLFIFPETWRWALKYSGYSAVGFLAFSLALTPLKLIFPKWLLMLKLNRYRREFGIASFSYIAIHILSYAIKLSDFNKILHVAWVKAYMPVVWFAFPILLAMTATSNQTAIKKLGYITWKRLHQNVYWAELAVFLHLALLRRTSILYWVFVPLIFLQLIRLSRTYRNFKQKE